MSNYDFYNARCALIPKYRNKPCVYEGIKFASIKEVNRYCLLKYLEKAGQIDDLVCHPKYEVWPAFDCRGKHYRAINYTLDFQYHENGRIIVEDVKSEVTRKCRDYIMRVKLLLSRYPEIEFREVV